MGHRGYDYRRSTNATKDNQNTEIKHALISIRTHCGARTSREEEKVVRETGFGLKAEEDCHTLGPQVPKADLPGSPQL